MDDVLLIGGPHDGDRFPDYEEDSFELPQSSVEPFGTPYSRSSANVLYTRHVLDGWSESSVFIAEEVEISDELLLRYLKREPK